MVVPAGSICKIYIGDGIDEPVRGVTAEGTTVSLSSEFSPLVSDSSGNQDVLGAIDMAGASLRSLTGGKFGFSSKFKQMTTQMWNKTSPVNLSINLDFHRLPLPGDNDKSVNAGSHVMNVVKRICKASLPVEQLAGNLVPPGPSVIEGLGADDFIDRIKSNKSLFSSTEDDSSEDGVRVGSGIVNVVLGGLTFNRLLMIKADPTFSSYTDTQGYPISCRVAFQFYSLWAATDKMVDEWSS